ncbi:7586_t:CDS:2 [Funneliformis geosporum]|nr:7586_t:CDS:2 [Funneliformis geosporum]
MTDILVTSNNQLKYIYPTDEVWHDINDLCILMEPIYEATKLISENSSTLSLIATAINNKLYEYWIYLNKSSKIASIIDLSHKLSIFDEININEAKEFFKEKYKGYMMTTNFF